MLKLIGGRKAMLILIAIALVALRNVLGLDAQAVEQILYLALGGSGVIALEDAVRAVREKK